MAQKNRKINKKRGTRSCGYGNAQKHRGAGSRGGRGMAGSWTHKQKKMFLEGRKFGKIGFKRHASLKKNLRVINLADIDARIEAWAAEGKAEKKAGGYSLDLKTVGYDKVLGSGNLTHKIEIKAESFSEKAKERVEKSGGKALATNGLDTA